MQGFISRGFNFADDFTDTENEISGGGEGVVLLYWFQIQNKTKDA